MDEEILALRERLIEATNNVASFDLAARAYRIRAEAAEARVAELQHALLGRNERVRELEARELWQQASEDDPGPIATAPLLEKVDAEAVREDLIGYDLHARERIEQLERRLAGQEAANASLRARVTELLEQRDEYRARIAELEGSGGVMEAIRRAGQADKTAYPGGAWEARARKAEERVAQLERALATLHATTTKGGSF